MSELVFVKLGGSLITDKTRAETPRLLVIERLAQEIAMALSQRQDISLVLGHGSGSFGHTAAHQYRVHEGGLSDWMGYAKTGAAAQRLNRLVVEALLRAGVCAVSMQPSASAICHKGHLEQLSVEPIRNLLARGAVPLVYGDVAVDRAQGCTIISTEQVFGYLSRVLEPDRILIVGEVDGVYTSDPRYDEQAKPVARITPAESERLFAGLSGSHGLDVTGGMRTKVELLLQMVSQTPSVQVRIIGGTEPGHLHMALNDPHTTLGTCIASG